MIPWPDAEWRAMQDEARLWRAKLHACEHRGTLFLLDGRAALGVINLGNVEYVKALLPEAVTILVDASLETIRRRLVARGVNTPEQIDERLGNAARVQEFRKFYDYVVTNEEGVLNEAETYLRNLIASK